MREIQESAAAAAGPAIMDEHLDRGMTQEQEHEREHEQQQEREQEQEQQRDVQVRVDHGNDDR